MGEKINQTSDFVIIRASDGAEIKVVLPPGEAIGSRFVQIRGRATGSNSMDADRVQNAGDNFDLATYNNLVTMTHQKFANLFL
jgi:hypothetical protein